MPDGAVLVADGDSALGSANLYDPATNAWTTSGSLNTAREDQTANLLANGQVLIAGGVNFVTHKFTELTNAELYTPANGQVRPDQPTARAPDPDTPSRLPRSQPLPSGLAGGAASYRAARFWAAGGYDTRGQMPGPAGGPVF